MKNLKISETAHQKLKVLAANENIKIGVLASEAIIQYVDRKEKRKSKKK